MSEVTALGDSTRRYLDEPEPERDAPLLRVVLEANESPSEHRVFVYRGDELLGQLPAMRADVDVQPGEVARLNFSLRVSAYAQVKSVKSVKRGATAPRSVQQSSHPKE